MPPVKIYFLKDARIRVARTIDEVKELLEVGFEYVMDTDGAKILRKRK